MLFSVADLASSPKIIFYCRTAAESFFIEIPFLFLCVSLVQAKRACEHILHTTFHLSFWGHHTETYGDFLNSYLIEIHSPNCTFNIIYISLVKSTKGLETKFWEVYALLLKLRFIWFFFIVASFLSVTESLSWNLVWHIFEARDEKFHLESICFCRTNESLNPLEIKGI